MPKRGKRYRQLIEGSDSDALQSIGNAIASVKKRATANFTESVDVAVTLGIDNRQSDQRVRGTVILPHGTGKSPKVAVIAQGEQARVASEAGADEVGGKDLVDKIDQGFKNFDYLLATPDLMRMVSKLGRKLGPKMPSARRGTVTNDLGEVVTQLKAGRLEFRTDPNGVVHAIIGKASYTEDQLNENFATFIDSILRARPASVRGQFLQSIALSSTMGPSVKIDIQEAIANVN